MELEAEFVTGTLPEMVNAEGLRHLKGATSRLKGFDAATMRVRATLYSQAWAPHYLKERFTDVPDGPEGQARRRLYYLASHLDTEGTPIENWKFEIATASTSAAERKEEEEKRKAKEAEEAASGDGKGCG